MRNTKIKKLTIILFAALAVSTLFFAACGGNRGHKVEFEVNGGEAISPVYSIDEVDLPDAKREGYTFNGWYTAVDENGNVTGDRVQSHYTVTEPVKLYADWLPFTLDEVYDGYELTKAVTSLTELTVPSEFGGLKITSVAANAFADCADITKVTLPSSVNRIGASAFKGCGKLAQIVLGGKITSIEENTFLNCSSLSAIDITGVTSIGAAAFKGCSALQSLTAGTVIDVADDSFDGCSKLITEQSGVKYINNCAVGVAEGITTVTLKQGTVAVWAYAFRGSLITSADISGVEFVGDYAFAECGSLQTVTLGNNIKSIGSNAFYLCGSLGNIALPVSLENLGYAAFYGCSKLTGVTLPQKVAAINANAFNGCVKLESINLDNCTSIGVSAFEGCEVLSGVNLQNVTTIGASAFKGCPKITSVTLSSLKNLHSEAFAGTSVSSIDLPETVTAIPNGAFDGCTELTEINLDGVTEIGKNAFRGCALTEVDLSENLTYIGADAFEECALTKVSYAGDLVDWVGIEFAEYANPIAISHNLYIDDEAVNRIVLLSDSDRNVEKISAYAFDGLGNISSVVIDNTVTEIGENAFRGCTVANVYYKGDEYGWNSIIKNGNEFSEESVKAYGGLTEITLPAEVTAIYAHAFGDCYNLTSITIGAGVTEIGEGAFANCYSLTTITFNGTVDQWNKITKPEGWDDSTGDYTVKCTDGEINKTQD